MSTFLKIILVAFALMTVQLLNAQNKTEDVIYFKNGSIIHGKIIEQIPDKYVKIEIVGKNIFVYPTNEIEKIIKETVANNDSDSAYYKSRGYFNMVEFGYMTPNSEDGDKALSMHFIGGYQFNIYFLLGANVGIDRYSTMDIFPISADIRGYFLKGKISPFYYLGGGYGGAILNYESNTKYKGGSVLYGGIGFKNNITEELALFLSIGYKTQEAQQIYEYQYPGSKRTREYYYRDNRITFNFGFIF